MKSFLLLFLIVTLAIGEKQINGWYIPERGDAPNGVRNWADSYDSILSAYASKLTIGQDTFTIRAPSNPNSVNFSMYGNSEKTDDVNHMNFYRSRGTYDNPLPIQAYGALGTSADDFWNYRSWGWNGSAYGLGSEIAVVPTEDWTDSTQGCNYQMYLTPTGALGMTECMHVDANGISPGNGEFLCYNAAKGFKLYAPSNNAISSLAAMYKSRGSLSSPTNINSSDPLGQFAFYGYGDSSYNVSAQFIAVATQGFTDSTRGSAFNFYTTDTVPGSSPTISAIMYGDNTYFANPVGVGGITDQVANLMVKHNSSNKYGFRIKDIGSGRNADVDTWDQSVGVWNAGQFTWYNLSTGIKMNMSSAGNVAIGDGVSQTSEKLYINGDTKVNGAMAVIGLPAHANNAAAAGGGLAVGDFYRTGGDPDLVCVVH